MVATNVTSTHLRFSTVVARSGGSRVLGLVEVAVLQLIGTRVRHGYSHAAPVAAIFIQKSAADGRAD
ncbi:MAG: hypothetical protein CMQ29_11090 [Gammaproteobacteria bacterium]|nr:hypothetical protein [Gammaproteobacteria bacterium]